jgi:hypothetical protein
LKEIPSEGRENNGGLVKKAENGFVIFVFLTREKDFFNLKGVVV